MTNIQTATPFLRLGEFGMLHKKNIPAQACAQISSFNARSQKSFMTSIWIIGISLYIVHIHTAQAACPAINSFQFAQHHYFQISVETICKAGPTAKHPWVTRHEIPMVAMIIGALALLPTNFGASPYKPACAQTRSPNGTKHETESPMLTPIIHDMRVNGHHKSS